MTDETGRRDIHGEAEDPVTGPAKPPSGPYTGSASGPATAPPASPGGMSPGPAWSPIGEQPAASGWNPSAGPGPVRQTPSSHTQTWAVPPGLRNPGPPPDAVHSTGQWPVFTPGIPAEEPQQRPRRNGMPLWAVLLLVMVVAAGSAGVGGMVGASLVAPEESPPPQSSGALNNEVPSDVPSRAPDTIAGVAQRVSPSVVSIRSTSPQLSGNGSGFVIEGNYVVTNNHVVDAVRRGGIEVVYSDGHVSRAEVVGAAASSDLAVLKLADPLDVEPLEFGDSDEVAVGDTVIAIGAPLGLDGTVTSGIVSALNRPVTVGEDGQEAYLSAIQTDAAINPGNSGGPLVNEQGLVIGVNSAIATMSGSSGEQSGSIGLGFAIPSNQASRVVEQLIETGEAPHAVIGAILDLRYPEQGALIMEAGRGAETVMRGGPADQAGLRPGDVIVEFDGTTVRDATQLITLIHTKAPGDRVEVRYLRNGREHTTTLVLGSSND
ncbi:trypsin-like serine proteases typically periplasmic contain C-terminal PDZ domain [Thermobifida fusca YX]|jgi:putative serine protease PepD|uniref:Trypsin-like serine proteases typically periplasmic contain C-terminal PDZ domain n=1 Tax=Thermobifida fusca (strain YX) TaxID=269800 RepID=Q47SM2_THEFY|nr:trypsin-like peptidase domain-containing protein [Thermobifida fusca]AAZ54545.1 trypsin-like serine proteases typically periplasmic contain C-terminal PDZ domain [Thermobifida fusca YX]MDD6793169.1 trypsin-like peptidase domain-containing protein [Thermobifida fusca]